MEIIKFLACLLYLTGVAFICVSLDKKLSLKKLFAINLVITYFFLNKIYYLLYLYPFISNFFLFVSVFNILLYLVYYYSGFDIDKKQYIIVWLCVLPLISFISNRININFKDKIEIQIKSTNKLIFYKDIKHCNADSFVTAVQQISKKIKIDPNYLMAIMYFESGLIHNVQNPFSGATGLIQFMPFTAKHLNTTTLKLSQMTPIEQLVYVEKYFKNCKNINSFYDLYLYVFYPKAIQMDDGFIFPRSVYLQNALFDINGDRVLTKYEIKKYLYKYFYLYRKELNL